MNQNQDSSQEQTGTVLLKKVYEILTRPIFQVMDAEIARHCAAELGDKFTVSARAASFRNNVPCQTEWTVTIRPSQELLLQLATTAFKFEDEHKPTTSFDRQVRPLHALLDIVHLFVSERDVDHARAKCEGIAGVIDRQRKEADDQKAHDYGLQEEERLKRRDRRY